MEKGEIKKKKKRKRETENHLTNRIGLEWLKNQVVQMDRPRRQWSNGPGVAFERSQAKKKKNTKTQKNQPIPPPKKKEEKKRIEENE